MLGIFKTPHFIKTIKWIIISILLMIIPAVVMAGWLDFIGVAAKAGAEAYIHTIYINAVERNIVIFQFIIYSILATIQGIAAYLVIRNFRLSFESVNKDNKISLIEGILLGIQAFISAVICIGLILFAAFLFYIVYDGIQEIRSYEGLEYSETIN